MIQIFVKLLQRLSHDLWRFSALVALVAILLWLESWLPKASNEAALSPLLTSSAIVLAIAALSHLTRRVLFPKLDLQKIAVKALEHPIGAAIVFFGICLVLAVLVYANVTMLR